MKMQHWMAVLVTLWILGCQAPAPTTQPMPEFASSEQVERIRQAYKAQNPNIIVGVVEDVLPAENLAAIGDVNVQAFKEGETVCFVDSTTAPLVCGKVVRITDAQLHVKFENPTGDHRAPMKGDLAIAKM
jgi:hypothetical protein